MLLISSIFVLEQLQWCMVAECLRKIFNFWILETFEKIPNGLLTLSQKT